MNPAENIVKKQKRFKTLCRNIFSGGEGKELLEYLENVYVNGRLYFDTDRETVYSIAQRDLVMQLRHYVITAEDGVDVS